MKSIITLICTIAATFAFGNGRCNNSYNNTGVGNSSYITVIDTIRAWNGHFVGQLFKIKGHEYIVVRSGSAVQIIHAESCPCKSGGVSNQCDDDKRS